MAASRPRATIENSAAELALIFRNSCSARAAASNAGPRLAEVAGRLCCNELLRRWAERLRLGILIGGGALFGLFERLHDGIRRWLESEGGTLLESKGRRSCA